MDRPPSRLPGILTKIGRIALCANVVYIGSWLGWSWAESSMPGQGERPDSMAARIFQPLDRLAVRLLSYGLRQAEPVAEQDAEPQDVEAEIRKARMTLERMGHRTR